MLEFVAGLPDNVVGIVAKGRVTMKDWTGVLIPKLEKALEWHHKLRLYYEIRTRYPGAGWDELALGAGDATRWERIAIVTDTAWIRHTVNALRLLIPGDIRVFAANEIPEGLAWITSLPTERRHSASAAALRRDRTPPFQPPLQYLHRASTANSRDRLSETASIRLGIQGSLGQ